MPNIWYKRNHRHDCAPFYFKHITQILCSENIFENDFDSLFFNRLDIKISSYLALRKRILQLDDSGCGCFKLVFFCLSFSSFGFASVSLSIGLKYEIISTINQFQEEQNFKQIIEFRLISNHTLTLSQLD